MCGIAGFLDPGIPIEARAEAVLRMCTAMIHRGPDDSGITSQGPATIGVRRLAIFDPANGHQPMASRDGRYSIVFNGAIYNFRTLRPELENAGWSFQTHCDTEVLLAALVHWGEGALKRLRGMFAFALWDRRDEILFAARDPLGIKPLYFLHERGRLVFASEVGALLASGAHPREIDPVAIADYLAWFAVPAPRTIYRGITSLQPGECLRFHKGELELRRDWNFQAIPADPEP
jgi:asparagine synthase (glutamine-hydrolysing)